MDELGQFILDMLFVSRFSLDHEDAMNEILYHISQDEYESSYEEILTAANFAMMYHYPTTMEYETLERIRFEITERDLNE